MEQKIFRRKSTAGYIFVGLQGRGIGEFSTGKFLQDFEISYQGLQIVDLGSDSRGQIN